MDIAPMTLLHPEKGIQSPPQHRSKYHRDGRIETDKATTKSPPLPHRLWLTITPPGSVVNISEEHHAEEGKKGNLFTTSITSARAKAMADRNT
jgi:hypothetical protein